jgi:hypothetical protein
VENGSVEYRSSNKTVFSAKYHLIWCPKYRRRVLPGARARGLRVPAREGRPEVGAPGETRTTRLEAA